MFHHARDPQPPTPTPSHCQGHRQGAMRTVPGAVPMFAHQQKTIQNQHLDCEFADGKGATVGLPKNERLARFVAMGYWSCKSCLKGINALLQATEPLNHATLPTKLLGSQGIISDPISSSGSVGIYYAYPSCYRNQKTNPSMINP